MVKSRPVISKSVGANASNIKSNANVRPVLRPSTHSKSKWVFLISTAIVFIALITLFLLSGTEQATKTTTLTESQATGAQPTTPAEAAAQLAPDEEEDSGGLIGMAIIGFKELNPVPQSAAKGFAAINPPSATAYMDSSSINPANPQQLDATPNPFVVQVEAYPHNINVGDATQKLTHFLIKLRYLDADFEFVSGKIFNDKAPLIPATKFQDFDKWKIKQNSAAEDGLYKIATFEVDNDGVPSAYYPYGESVVLAELTFKPKKSKGTSNIVLHDIKISNSLKEDPITKTYYDVIKLDSVAAKNIAAITFNMKLYRDDDGDTYGGTLPNYYSYAIGDALPGGYVANNDDCVDAKTNDPAKITCPVTKAACTYFPPDGMDPTNPANYPNYYGPECAICRNPLATEICDGIDNNCNNQVDEIGKPTCAASNQNCGTFWKCKGTFSLDCNNDPPVPGFKFDSNERCNYNNNGKPFCDVALGQCVPSLGQDCTLIQQQLDKCNQDLTTCKNDLFTCIDALPTCDQGDCTQTYGGTCNKLGYCVIPSTGPSCTMDPVTGSVTLILGNLLPPKKFDKTCVDGVMTVPYCLKLDDGSSTVGIKETTCQAGCSNGACISDCPEVEPFVPIYELTPACDNKVCDPFENCKTCSADCTCDPSSVDTDGDGVPNDPNGELTSGEITTLKYTKLAERLTKLGKTDCTGLADCDGDGVNDDMDYCPNTYIGAQGDYTTKTGKINAYGCYAADVGIGIQTGKSKLRPDGCFSFWDTTYYVHYYKNLVEPNTCTDMFGNPVGE